MELKKTTKYDVKEKVLRIIDGNIINEDGEIVDLIAMFQKAYGDSQFDLSTTAKIEGIFDLGATV